MISYARKRDELENSFRKVEKLHEKKKKNKKKKKKKNRKKKNKRKKIDGECAARISIPKNAASEAHNESHFTRSTAFIFFLLHLSRSTLLPRTRRPG
jgi:mannitol-specific phosphotransferase system IIBC component